MDTRVVITRVMATRVMHTRMLDNIVVYNKVVDAKVVDTRVGNMNKNMSVLETEWEKFSPFSGEIHLLCSLNSALFIHEYTSEALCRQVLLRLASSAPENLSAKCTSCSFNSSTPEFMFEFTSPRKLGSVNSNMNSGVREAESVKFSSFSGELHLKLMILVILFAGCHSP